MVKVALWKIKCKYLKTKYHILLMLLLVLGIEGGRIHRKRDPMVRKMLHGQIKYKSGRALRGTISANPSSQR